MANTDRNSIGGINSVDQLFSTISTECALHVLHYFKESSEAVASLENLSDFVATQDGDTPSRDPEDTAIRLHHCTIPKLAKAGVVDYDCRQHTVRYREHPVVEEYLSFLDETDESMPLQTALVNVSEIALEE